MKLRDLRATGDLLDRVRFEQNPRSRFAYGAICAAVQSFSAFTAAYSSATGGLFGLPYYVNESDATGVGCCRATRLAAAHARITSVSLAVLLVIAD